MPNLIATILSKCVVRGRRGRADWVCQSMVVLVVLMVCAVHFKIYVRRLISEIEKNLVEIMKRGKTCIALLTVTVTCFHF